MTECLADMDGALLILFGNKEEGTTVNIIPEGPESIPSVM
jgi:hypothetical protein